ncbi:hypothetical protein [Sphaerisporangium sp. NPDC051011]|uniref:hypothetical protein n=1 Tax=Sphaerisporangium sp. NPDC051011 TaxID=3155792 RepID=UPI0033F71922
MSENTHIVVRSKNDQMSAVHIAINKTKMATAKVWNPWTSVCESGVNIDSIKTAAGGGQVPEIIRDEQTISDIKPVVLRSLGSDLGFNEPVNQSTFEEARKRARNKYVSVGRANYRSLASGNCTLFACCVIGMLAAQPALLGPGVKVELLNLVDTEGGSGHAYVVVGRAEGDVKDIGGYGPDCFFIDQWYARQRRTDPGIRGVKDATQGVEGNPFWDPAFVPFISHNTTPRLMLTFTSDELSKLGL